MPVMAPVAWADAGDGTRNRQAMSSIAVLGAKADFHHGLVTKLRLKPTSETREVGRGESSILGRRVGMRSSGETDAHRKAAPHAGQDARSHASSRTGHRILRGPSCFFVIHRHC